MTFTSEGYIAEFGRTNNMSNNNMGKLLADLLRVCNQQHRLVCGIVNSAQIMAIEPANVLLCILPEQVDDVSMHIHALLLEALCNENDIEMVKVDSVDKLAAIVDSKSADHNIYKTVLPFRRTKSRSDRRQAFRNHAYSVEKAPSDCNCLIILKVGNPPALERLFLSRYQACPFPVIKLPQS